MSNTSTITISCKEGLKLEPGIIMKMLEPCVSIYPVDRVYVNVEGPVSKEGSKDCEFIIRIDVEDALGEPGVTWNWKD